MVDSQPAGSAARAFFGDLHEAASCAVPSSDAGGGGDGGPGDHAQWRRNPAGRGDLTLLCSVYLHRLELGLTLKDAKTRVAELREGGEGLHFLGFHHRWVPGHTPASKHLRFLARWPSRQAVQRARERIRQLTDRRRLHPAAHSLSAGWFSSAAASTAGIWPSTGVGGRNRVERAAATVDDGDLLVLCQHQVVRIGCYPGPVDVHAHLLAVCCAVGANAVLVQAHAAGDQRR
jgi:hypothetical protein